MAEEQTLQVFRDFSRDLEALVGAIKQFGDKDGETYLGLLHGFHIILDRGNIKVSHERLMAEIGRRYDPFVEDDLTNYLEEHSLRIDELGADCFAPEGRTSNKRAMCVQTTVSSRLDKSLYNAVVLLSNALRNYKVPVKVEIRINRKIEEFT